MTVILLVRHGQSVWNADGRWQGQENPPLSELGRGQAGHAAAAVGVLDAIYSSPLDRALQTASIIGEETGVGPVNTLHGLVERNAGAWQGLTRAEIERGFPGFLADGRRPPGWEDDRAVEDRSMDSLERIVVEHPHGQVLVVAHAGIIFAIERLLGADWERLANLSGRVLERSSDGDWTLGDRVHLLIQETIPDQL